MCIFSSVYLYFFLLVHLYFISHESYIVDPVAVSFDPTTYNVTEGVDNVANLRLVRSGGLNRTVVVTVSIASGTAMGITHHCLLQNCVIQ